MRRATAVLPFVEMRQTDSYNLVIGLLWGLFLVTVCLAGFIRHVLDTVLCQMNDDAASLLSLMDLLLSQEFKRYVSRQKADLDHVECL